MALLPRTARLVRIEGPSPDALGIQRGSEHLLRDERCLTTFSEAELAPVDPLVMNLLVAKGVATLNGLDITQYRRLRDDWAAAFARKLPGLERHFRLTPQDWDHDIWLFRLGMLCMFLHDDLGIRYHEDEKYVKKITYADPSHLFVSGVMDTRKGTCGNMVSLYVALGWRLGWPVSVALARWHCVVRFDNGEVRHNIEVSNAEGGFRVPPDDHYKSELDIPQEHIDCGSDLTFLKPRQLLGCFIGYRGRHYWDIIDIERARHNFLVALYLFPQSRLFARMADDCYLYLCMDNHTASTAG